MNGSERIMAMFERRPVDRPGFRMGAPTEEALRKYLAQTGLDSHESLSDYMQDDAFWAAAEVRRLCGLLGDNFIVSPRTKGCCPTSRLKICWPCVTQL